MANVLPTHKRVAIVSALIEGNSIRATARMVGCSKNTVTKLLVELGATCSEYQSETLRGLPCKRVQVDEIWSFCQMKAKTAREKGREHEHGVGDVWTFTAISADTKLVPSWLVGSRDGGSAVEFCRDLADRLASRIQLTSDGHNMYLEAVEDAFGMNVDYAMLQKIYGEDPQPQKRYSPAKCIGVKGEAIQGDPDPAHVSTSYVERQNLTMRMQMRRFTRLTNAFSKKVENHAHAIALHFMAYNFVKPHGTLTKAAKGTHTTPAMAAGVATKPWAIEDVVGLLRSN
jgi:IS1 family transposase